MTIPNNPAPGREWTNDVTGVTYVWDGERWFIVDNTEDIDLSGYVTDAEFEADQQRQDDVVTEALSIQDGIQQEQSVQNSQINTLETQVQLLAQTQAAGKWDYKRNISGGSVRPPTSATFYATHKDGADRVLLNWSDARLLMISKTDKTGTEFIFTGFEEGDKVEILATDGSSLCVGTITNQPTMEAYGNMVIAVERSNGGPSEDKEYILSVYRPGANGGEVDLDILDGRYLKLKDANVVNNNFRIKSDTKTYFSTAGGEMALNHVKEPTNSHHAATKSYVDSKVGTGIAPPAHLRWIWRQYDSTIDPGEGKFAYNSSSGFFRINYITADGVNLGKSRPSSKDISFDTNLTGSIWYKDGDGWRLKQMFDVYRMQWDRNDCIWLYRRSIIVGSDSFTADVQYHITIGGLF